METTLQRTRQNLPPTEIDCKWWKRGYYFRGNNRHHQHHPSPIPSDRELSRQSSPTLLAISAFSVITRPSRALIDPEEKNVLYACRLLLNCDHVFCLGIWFSVQHCGCFARSYIYKTITIILRLYSRLERFHQASLAERQPTKS